MRNPEELAERLEPERIGERVPMRFRREERGYCISIFYAPLSSHCNGQSGFNWVISTGNGIDGRKERRAKTGRGIRQVSMLPCFHPRDCWVIERETCEMMIRLPSEELTCNLFREVPIELS